MAAHRALHLSSAAALSHSLATARSARLQVKRTACRAHWFSSVLSIVVPLVGLEPMFFFRGQLNESCRVITYAGA